MNITSVQSLVGQARRPLTFPHGGGRSPHPGAQPGSAHMERTPCLGGFPPTPAQAPPEPVYGQVLGAPCGVDSPSPGMAELLSPTPCHSLTHRGREEGAPHPSAEMGFLSFLSGSNWAHLSQHPRSLFTFPLPPFTFDSPHCLSQGASRERFNCWGLLFWPRWQQQL